MAESTNATLHEDRRQAKLRSACDRCSSNKVKCSQERPGCQRCLSLNLPCHYSPSLRMGKPPRSRQLSKRVCCSNVHDENSAGLKPLKPATAAATTSAATTQIPMLGDQFASQANEMMSTMVPSWPDDFDYESILNDDHPTFHPLSPNSSDTPRGSSIIDLGYSHPPLSDCPDVLPDLSKPTESMREIVESVLYDAMQEEDRSRHPTHQGRLGSLTPISLNGLTSTRSNSNNQHSNETKGSTGSSPTSSSHYQCIRLAMETLDCLYRVSSANSSDAGSSNPSVDHILQVNGDAMKAATTVLACPCTKDFCLLIILATIPCKVLAQYQAVVNMRDPHIRVAAGEATLRHPIAIGAYTLDEEASRMVMIQVVLSKVRDLSRFIQTYIDTFCCNANSNRQGHCGLVYRTLGLFIQSRLGNTADELQEKLAALVGDGHLNSFGSRAA